MLSWFCSPTYSVIGAQVSWPTCLSTPAVCMGYYFFLSYLGFTSRKWKGTVHLLHLGFFCLFLAKMAFVLSRKSPGKSPASSVCILCLNFCSWQDIMENPARIETYWRDVVTAKTVLSLNIQFREANLEALLGRSEKHNRANLTSSTTGSLWTAESHMWYCYRAS